MQILTEPEASLELEHRIDALGGIGLEVAVDGVEVLLHTAHVRHGRSFSTRSAQPATAQD